MRWERVDKDDVKSRSRKEVAASLEGSVRPHDPIVTHRFVV